MKRIFKDPYLYLLVFLLYPLYPYMGDYISLGTDF